MPINVDLLIAAPMLQDALVDKDGTPMSGGIVTCYQDNSRTTLKNWYYQSGTPGAYTYIRLPNPLTLSAAGTICDVNGVDTIPFFYPFSETDQNVKQPYYITIVNHDQTNQITRANFPFIPDEDNEPGQGSHNNYVINNRFWRNIGTLNATDILDTVVCPGQHDGFASPDVHFVKNVTGGQDTITFTKFPLTLTPILTGDITPEFYINHTCANTPTGETQKAYMFPISLHVNTLASVPFTFTIQVQNIGGTSSGQNVINLYVLQDTGTGTVSPSPFLIGSVTANSSWTKYEFTSVFPATAGLTLSQGGDDALYLLVQMPLDIACSINFCLPSIYLTSDAPTNSFQTYDEIDTVIGSPRTGDIRTSLNYFSPYGWIPANNGTIGNTSSTATTRANTDTWQLYNLIWTNILDIYAPVSGGRGVSAYADFTANKQLALTRNLGYVLAGGNAALTVPLTITSVDTVGDFFTVDSTATLITGSPVQFTNTGGGLPSPIAAGTIYFARVISGQRFDVFPTVTDALALTNVVNLTTTGSGTSVVLSALGGYQGASYDIFNINQLPASFGLTLAGTNLNNIATTGGSNLTGITGVNATSVPITNPGGGQPLSVMQPTTYMNVFLKL